MTYTGVHAGWKLDNSDLWKRLDCAVSQREPGNLRMRKCKGHAELADVIAGTVSQADRLGNHGADRLATEGA
eukprot:6200417-Karenia_brevis.AAC.1